MAGGGQRYNVYVYSYLGFGLMQGRGAVLGRTDGAHCVNRGSKGVYKSPFGGQEYSMLASDLGSSFANCAKSVLSALKIGDSCGGGLPTECSFNGAWGGAASHSERSFYLMSYFFDRCGWKGLSGRDGVARVSVDRARAAHTQFPHHATLNPHFPTLNR